MQWIFKALFSLLLLQMVATTAQAQTATWEDEDRRAYVHYWLWTYAHFAGRPYDPETAARRAPGVVSTRRAAPISFRFWPDGPNDLEEQLGAIIDAIAERDGIHRAGARLHDRRGLPALERTEIPFLGQMDPAEARRRFTLLEDTRSTFVEASNGGVEYGPILTALFGDADLANVVSARDTYAALLHTHDQMDGWCLYALLALAREVSATIDPGLSGRSCRIFRTRIALNSLQSFSRTEAGIWTVHFTDDDTWHAVAVDFDGAWGPP